MNLAWFGFNAVLFLVFLSMAPSLAVFTSKVLKVNLANSIYGGILLAAFLFVLVHHLLGPFMKKYIEGFEMPDSRPIPPCPLGSERGGKNGMDCKSKGDLYGM